jgi:hypothetical protein
MLSITINYATGYQNFKSDCNELHSENAANPAA